MLEDEADISIDNIRTFVEREEHWRPESLNPNHRKIGLTEERAMFEKLRKAVAPRRFQLAEGRLETTERRQQLAPISAREMFFQMVDEIAFGDRVPFDVAMAKVKAQRPEMVEAAFSPRRRFAAPVDRELLAA